MSAVDDELEPPLIEHNTHPRANRSDQFKPGRNWDFHREWQSIATTGALRSAILTRLKCLLIMLRPPLRKPETTRANGVANTRNN